VKSLGPVGLFATSWTIAYQVPLSMGFCSLPGKSTGVGCHFLPGDLPDPGLNPGLLHCRQMLYCLGHQGSPGENVNGCNHYGKQYGASFKQLKIKLPYAPASPLLGS